MTLHTEDVSHTGAQAEFYLHQMVNLALALPLELTGLLKNFKIFCPDLYIAGASILQLTHNLKVHLFKILLKYTAHFFTHNSFLMILSPY